jgi:hypothetical protein
MLCRHNAELQIVNVGDTYSYHWPVKSYVANALKMGVPIYDFKILLIYTVIYVSSQYYN